MTAHPAQCLSEEMAFAFVRRTLGEDERRAVEEHLNRCEDCQVVVSELLKYYLEDPKTIHAAAEGVGTTDDSLPLAAGTQVARYVVGKPLGAGSGGIVYEAEDPELGRKVGLKLLRPFRSPHFSPAEAQARLLREARAMAQLSHANVVGIHDTGTYEGQIFLVMEFVKGETLTTWLQRQPRSWREILDAFVLAGRGLAAAHGAGIVHGDFKPDNVLVGSDGRIRVTDFGLARPMNAPAPAIAAALDVPHSSDRTIVGGTPLYMAPEQFRGEPANALTDQYSFCVAVFQALYLHFTDDQRLALPPSLPAAPPVLGQRTGTDAPGALLGVLFRGLRSVPDERFASIDELLTALEPPAVRRPRSRRWMAVPLAIVVVTAALVGRRFLAGSACIAGITVGERHACAWKRDGTVWCWGSESHGQVGSGTVSDAPRLVPVQVLTESQGRPLTDVATAAVGPDASCAVKHDGTVWCWGYNQRWLLARGKKGERVPFAGAARSDDKGTVLGDIIRISVAPSHACAQRRGGAIWCWGNHVQGQLGIGINEAGWGLSPRGVPPARNHGPGYALVDVGGNHTCAALLDGTAYCWGGNRNRQLGSGRDDEQIVSPVQVLTAERTPLTGVERISAGMGHTCALVRGGRLWCWGEGKDGELGTGRYEITPLATPVLAETTEPFMDVGAGWAHTCARRRDGSVWCFGRNDGGQLGDGGRALGSATPIAVLDPSGDGPLNDVTLLAVGMFSNCALRKGGAVLCWGRNDAGQLGTGDTQDRSTPTPAQLTCP